MNFDPWFRRVVAEELRVREWISLEASEAARLGQDKQLLVYLLVVKQRVDRLNYLRFILVQDGQPGSLLLLFPDL